MIQQTDNHTNEWGGGREATGVRGAPRYVQPGYDRPAVRNPLPKWRVFRWLFLAIQGGFVAWIITGLIDPSSSHAQKACGTDLFAQACKDGYSVGRGVAVAIIVAIWVAVDVILGMTYLVWRQKV
jgi:hypothetical protein